MNIPEEAVKEAQKILEECFDFRNYAQVSNYIWEGQTEVERRRGLRDLKKADADAEESTRMVIQSALEAAIKELPGVCSGCGSIVNGVYCGYCLE